MVLALVLSNGTGDGHWAYAANLPLGSYSPPTGEEVAMIGVAVSLDDLEDVVFVVIIGH